MKKYQAKIEERVAAAVIEASKDKDGNVHLRADQAVLALMACAGELLVLSCDQMTDKDVESWATNFTRFFVKRMVKARSAGKPANVIICPPGTKMH